MTFRQKFSIYNKFRERTEEDNYHMKVGLFIIILNAVLIYSAILLHWYGMTIFSIIMIIISLSTSYWVHWFRYNFFKYSQIWLGSIKCLIVGHKVMNIGGLERTCRCCGRKERREPIRNSDMTVDNFTEWKKYKRND